MHMQFEWPRCLTIGSTRTPTLAMASPFSWPVLVPCALRAPAPVNLGVRPHFRTIGILGGKTLFTFGLFGTLLVVAVPMFAVYAIAGLLLKAAIAVNNRSNAPVFFCASGTAIAKMSLFAWIFSLLLFLLCGAISAWLTYDSGDIILMLYPLLQKLACLAIFTYFLSARVNYKSGDEKPASRARLLWSFGISLVPTVVLMIAGNMWLLSQRH
jgi:hypothetical protein